MIRDSKNLRNSVERQIINLMQDSLDEVLVKWGETHTEKHATIKQLANETINEYVEDFLEEDE